MSEADSESTAMKQNPEDDFVRRRDERAKSGFESNLNEQQRQELEALKKRLFDPSFAFVEDAKAELDGDRFFLRFLRATMKDKKGKRIFDAAAAFERLERMYKWRKEYNIDELQTFIANGTVSDQAIEPAKDSSSN